MTALITRPGSDPGCPRRGQLGKEIQQQEVMLPNQTAFRYAKAKVAVKASTIALLEGLKVGWPKEDLVYKMLTFGHLRFILG